jgi:nucleoside 2-deoxyribosyltransferase
MLTTNQSSKSNEKCPVCGEIASVHDDEIIEEINCLRCGKYSIDGRIKQDILYLNNPKAKMALSHWIRKFYENKIYPKLFEYFPEEKDLLKLELPNPAIQADNLISCLGKESGSNSFKRQIYYDSQLRLSAITGCVTIDDLIFVLDHLKDTGYINFKEIRALQTGKAYELSFTFKGWQKYEELKKVHTESKQVFMAMAFGKEDTDNFYNNFLKHAVSQTGLELRRLDEVAKAGIIDNNMRIEIRKSCLLLSELSHGNNGAYFEAGFAEGLGIPVIYLCEKSVFKSKSKKKKPHFDTNHCTTIIWEKGKEAEAMEKLKATIRLSVPDKVKMEDEELKK